MITWKHVAIGLAVVVAYMWWNSTGINSTRQGLGVDRPVLACPQGCTYHPDSCDVKGNISFTTLEKIYHMPGGEFYSATEINTTFGERWFCTPAEAEANGWRRSAR